MRYAHLIEVESIIRFNLLWRRMLLVRHIDLFDNLALAKFLSTPSARGSVEYWITARIDTPPRAVQGTIRGMGFGGFRG